jgi:hypothetical protein
MPAADVTPPPETNIEPPASMVEPIYAVLATSTPMSVDDASNFSLTTPNVVEVAASTIVTPPSRGESAPSTIPPQHAALALWATTSRADAMIFEQSADRVAHRTTNLERAMSTYATSGNFEVERHRNNAGHEFFVVGNRFRLTKTVTGRTPSSLTTPQEMEFAGDEERDSSERFSSNAAF